MEIDKEYIRKVIENLTGIKYSNITFEVVCLVGDDKISGIVSELKKNNTFYYGDVLFSIRGISYDAFSLKMGNKYTYRKIGWGVEQSLSDNLKNVFFTEVVRNRTNQDYNFFSFNGYRIRVS